MTQKIKVLVVDDSMFFRNALIQKLNTHPDIEVIGYAINAYDAERKIPNLKPDVVTLDVEMPGLSGIQFVQKLIPKHPVPVILVSSLNISVFDALQAGAIDFVQKPDMSKPSSTNLFFSALAGKIRIASKAKVLPSSGRQGTLSAASRTSAAAAPVMPKLRSLNISGLKASNLVLAIGASTGGTEAILSVVKDLPTDTPGIVVTQHMPPGFTKMYAERLNKICKMSAREASDGDYVEQGLILVAPGDQQMELVKRGGRYAVRCFYGEKVSGHCPSVDVLFHSVAKTAGRSAIGTILTGMGRDGADGLLAMKKAGSFTIGQDQESCVVYGMPMVAYNIGAVQKQAPLASIPDIILSQLSKM